MNNKYLDLADDTQHVRNLILEHVLASHTRKVTLGRLQDLIAFSLHRKKAADIHWTSRQGRSRVEYVKAEVRCIIRDWPPAPYDPRLDLWPVWWRNAVPPTPMTEGITGTQADFEHPLLDVGHLLREDTVLSPEEIRVRREAVKTADYMAKKVSMADADALDREIWRRRLLLSWVKDPAVGPTVASLLEVPEEDLMKCALEVSTL